MHTLIVSDMHLSEAQRPDRRGPLWMGYKRREFFIDEDFARLLEHAEAEAEGPVELVLNGDIFDFDNITQLPDPMDPHAASVDWLSRKRGLSSEEWMSRFKMDCIIADHPTWFGALTAFLQGGNRAIFIIGNHDLELLWPAVQKQLCEAIGVPHEDDRVVFCDWFYLSGEDTFVSHGHQFDPYCVLKNPIDPLIEVHGRPRVRIPFGDLAGRYMLNGMGYFNPHATENFIMSGWEYAKFFARNMLTTQPLILWTWFWAAMVTLFISLRDHMRPAMRDPLLVDEKVQGIAARARATPSMVRKLNAISVPSACTRPMTIVRELWLDRAFLFLASLFVAWQLVLHVNIAWPINPLWGLVPLALLIPPYAMYARQVKSSVDSAPLLSERRATLIARITGAKNVVFGHSHVPCDEPLGPVRYLNGGFWSAAFAGPECTRRLGTQTFVWIRPGSEGEGERNPSVYEWPPGAKAPRPYRAPRPSAAPATEADALPQPDEHRSV